MTQKITLKDSHHRTIGYVEVKDNGDKTLKDQHYHIKGYYYARQNVTKDEHFKIIGKGDLLSSLLE